MLRKHVWHTWVQIVDLLRLIFLRQKMLDIKSIKLIERISHIYIYTYIYILIIYNIFIIFHWIINLWFFDSEQRFILSFLQHVIVFWLNVSHLIVRYCESWESGESGKPWLPHEITTKALVRFVYNLNEAHIGSHGKHHCDQARKLFPWHILPSEILWVIGQW